MAMCAIAQPNVKTFECYEIQHHTWLITAHCVSIVLDTIIFYCLANRYVSQFSFTVFYKRISKRPIRCTSFVHNALTMHAYIAL